MSVDEAQALADYNGVVTVDVDEIHRRDAHIEHLKAVLRAALSFVEGRHTDHNDGYAQMVIAAIRGALRKERD